MLSVNQGFLYGPRCSRVEIDKIHFSLAKSSKISFLNFSKIYDIKFISVLLIIGSKFQSIPDIP